MRLSSEQPNDAPQKLELPWADLCTAVYRHRGLILGCMAVAVTFTLVRGWLEPPEYEATATLLLKANRSHVAVAPDRESALGSERLDIDDLTSEAAILDSVANIRAALVELRPDLDEEPGWIEWAVGLPLELPGIFYRGFHGLPDPDPFEELAYHLHRRISVSIVPKSNLIHVAYASESPRWAAEFVNEVTNQGRGVSLGVHHHLGQEADRVVGDLAGVAGGR